MTDIEPAAPPPAPVDIPYGFARSHGVVIAQEEGGRWLVMRFLLKKLEIPNLNIADMTIDFLIEYFHFYL